MRTMFFKGNINLPEGRQWSTIRLSDKWADLKVGEVIACAKTQSERRGEIDEIASVLHVETMSYWEALHKSAMNFVVGPEVEDPAAIVSLVDSSVRDAYGRAIAMSEKVTLVAAVSLLYDARAAKIMSNALEFGEGATADAA